MTVREQLVGWLECHERGDESLAKYLERAAKELGLRPDTVKRKYHAQQATMRRVSETRDAEGRVITTKDRLQHDALIDDSDLPIVGTTTNVSLGQQWIIRRKGDEQIDYESAIMRAVAGLDIKPIVAPKTTNQSVVRAVYTDTHIGMDPDSEGLYGITWTEDDIEAVFDSLVEDVVKLAPDVVYLVDLGDFMDGYQKLTTRGGHTLEQNMTDEDAFSFGVRLKVKIVSQIIVSTGAKVYAHSVCNDNHAGAWGYAVNHAADEILRLLHPKTYSSFLQRKIMGHYKVGNTTFITLHGKDKKSQKKPVSVSVSKEFDLIIRQYIKANRIDGQVIVEKGDTHLQLFDMMRDIHYYHYRAIAPPSDYIRANYPQSQRGYHVCLHEDVNVLL